MLNKMTNVKVYKIREKIMPSAIADSWKNTTFALCFSWY